MQAVNVIHMIHLYYSSRNIRFNTVIRSSIKRRSSNMILNIIIYNNIINNVFNSLNI